MSAEDAGFLAARRAYELGRLRTSTVRGALVAALVAGVGVVASGPRALVWIPLTLAVWVFVHWRGRAVLRGSLYGLLGGLATTVLPMSILRPCCNPGAMSGPDCCTMPGACVASGALVGVLLSTVVPYKKASWWKTASGVALGMTSVAVVRCASLFAGEALGLLGGLVGGVALAACARVAFARRASA